MARHCSKCSKTGHYASTCNKKKSSKIRRYSNRTVTRSHRGASFVGFGRGWIVLYHGGKTGKTQHDKTWSAKIVKKGSGYVVVTRHGRRAGQKNESVRGITSLESAVAKLQALMNSKLRKGYRIVGANRRNPWSARDVKRHNKKCASKTACRKKWPRIANAVLKKSKDEGKAVRIANWQVKRLGLARKNPLKKLRSGKKARVCYVCRKKNARYVAYKAKGRNYWLCKSCLGK